jgi:hypothetical protein
MDQDTRVQDSGLNNLPTHLQSGDVLINEVAVTRLYFDPRLSFASAGEQVLVDVRVDPRNDPQLLSVFFSYDTSLVSFASGTLNTSVFDDMTYNQSPADSSGVVSFSAGALSALDSDVRAATLTFDAMTTGLADVGFLLLQPNETSIQTGSFDDVPFNATDGLIAIVGAPPVVQSITRTSAQNTTAQMVSFDVVFSMDVLNVDENDFDLTTGFALSDAQVTAVIGNGSIYEVQVDTGSGFGMLRLDVDDNDSIVGDSGLPLGGLGSGNGDYTDGEHYTITRPLIGFMLY